MNNKTGAGMRLTSLIVSRLSFLIILTLIIIIVFFVAYDLANVYVMLDDGLSQRAEIILKNEDPSYLDRFFSWNYLNSDPLLTNHQYYDYLISDYDYKVKVEKLWVWPWQSTTSVQIVEYIREDSWKYNITDSFRQRLTEIQMQEYLNSIEQDQEGDETDQDEEAPENPEQDQLLEEFVLKIPKPQWQNGRKEIQFRKIDGQWKIDGIVFLESIDPEDIE